jgi:MFS family permease
MSLANFVGPFCAGYSLKTFGYPETFLLLTFFGIIPSLLIGTNKVAIPPFPVSHGTVSRRGGAIGLLRVRELRVIYSVGLFSTGTYQLFGFLMPLHGVELGFDSVRIGWVIGVFALGSSLSRLVLPFFSRSMSAWSLLLSALAAAALSFAALAAVSNLVANILAAGCLGFAFGMCNPVAQALMLEAAPPGRAGEVQGLRAMMVGAIQTTVPIVAGGVSAAVGIGPVFGSFALLLGACCYLTRGRFDWRPRSASL